MRKKFLLTIITLFCAAFFVSAYLVQIVLIQGSSMEPAYHPWQLVLLNKRASRFESGDVIAFQSQSLEAVLIKRIVACPGDRVQIENGVLYVNGAPSRELPADHFISYAGMAQNPVTLGADEYFVLGDNYEESRDSRYPEIGCVSEEDILGTVFPQVHAK